MRLVRNFFKMSWRCCCPSWPYRCVTLQGFSLGGAPGSTPVILSSPNARPLLPKRTGISFAVIPFSPAQVSPRQAPSVSLPRGNVFSSGKSRGFSHGSLGPGPRSLVLSFNLNPRPLPSSASPALFTAQNQGCPCSDAPFFPGENSPTIPFLASSQAPSPSARGLCWGLEVKEAPLNFTCCSCVLKSNSQALEKEAASLCVLRTELPAKIPRPGP